MLIDMILHNPGEPELQTRYRNPAALHALGYEAIVISGVLAALPAASPAVDSPAAARAKRGGGTPQEAEVAIDGQIFAALGLGMKVFLHVELTLPPHLAERHREALCDDQTGHLCLAKDSACVVLRQYIEAVVARWPGIAGVVIAPPPTTTCTKCRNVAMVECLARLVGGVHTTLCEKLKKFYVQRLSSAHGGAVYAELARRLPASDHLVFSFELPNCNMTSPTAVLSTLHADARPKWLELSSEGQVEGKGAFPNYQGPLWRKILAGRQAGSEGGATEAMCQALDICGISRGGGHGGPYAQREEWIDANVHALAHLYHQNGDIGADPTADTALATQWASGAFGIAESSAPAPAIAEMLLISPEAIRKLLYVWGLREDPDAPPMPFLQNDLLDVEALWLAAARLVAAGAAQADQAIVEKEEALAGVDRMRKDWEIASQELPNKAQARDLANTLSYLGSFAATVVHLLQGFIFFQRWVQGGRADGELAQRAVRHLENAETNWQQHVQHHATLPGAPSVLHDNTLWERTNACLAALEPRKQA
jgi:hypothetical protein